MIVYDPNLRKSLNVASDMIGYSAQIPILAAPYFKLGTLIKSLRAGSATIQFIGKARAIGVAAAQISAYTSTNGSLSNRLNSAGIAGLIANPLSALNVWDYQPASLIGGQVLGGGAGNFVNSMRGNGLELEGHVLSLGSDFFGASLGSAVYLVPNPTVQLFAPVISEATSLLLKKGSGVDYYRK